MKTTSISVVLVALTIGLGFGVATGEDEEAETAKPHYTLKEIMKENKEGLLGRVKSGDASAEEKAKLLDMYLSLLENKPTKGSEDSWHKFATANVVAAAKVVAGREGALKDLAKATNCKACHTEHKK